MMLQTDTHSKGTPTALPDKFSGIHVNADTSSPHSCTPNPIPSSPNPHKCIHEFAQKVLPVLERVLLVIAGGQNLFCFFWLRYQAIISCNYFESCYRWISELSVLSRIHYSNAGSSLQQRGGHGRCRPPAAAAGDKCSWGR